MNPIINKIKQIVAIIKKDVIEIWKLSNGEISNQKENEKNNNLRIIINMEKIKNENERN